MAEIIDNYLREYLKVVDDFLKKEGSVVDKNYAFFKSFYRRENLEKIEWKDLQEMGKHIHSFNSMAIARGKALGRPNQSIEKYREALIYLIYGADSIERRINNVQADRGYSLPYFGRSALSELACYARPDEYLFINSRDIEAAKFLGIEINYPRKSRAGDKFIAFNNAIKPIIESYKSIIGKRTNTTIPLEVDQFFSWIYTNYVPEENDRNDDVSEDFEDTKEVIENSIRLKSGFTELDFDYGKFITDCAKANLYMANEFALRFVSSLIAKNFLILTGLSGSGKTKLALAFARWITTSNHGETSTGFYVGEEIKSSRVIYSVTACDQIAVTFQQSETGTKATFPFELIDEWIEAINLNDFTADTTPRKIRDAVEKTTSFSHQLNSFETHLKAAAFHLLSKTPSVSNKYRFCLVAVGADWTNREPLLGYPNALIPNNYIVPENKIIQTMIEANRNPTKPYFVILDEMNLSHVERYFADFLSAMESERPIPLHNGKEDWDGIPSSIHLPKNLFIIGTVNIDETTYMFSPKVLDRANVIEFRVTEDEMKNYLSESRSLTLNDLAGLGETMASSFVALAKDKNLRPNNAVELNTELMKFFSELKKTGAEFGYRTASEINRFVAVVNRLEPSWTIQSIIDAAIMQKLLPKVHGSRKKLEPVLRKLAELCLNDISIFNDYIKNGSDSIPLDKFKYPVSMEKIGRMYRALLENSFTSYAEA